MLTLWPVSSRGIRTGEEVRVAYFIREDLIPRALGFFLGEEDDGDDDDEDEDGEGDEDEDEEVE